MNTSIRIFASLAIVTFASVLSAQEKPVEKTEPPVDPKEWKLLYDGQTLKGWKSINFGGEGEVKVENRTLPFHSTLEK